MLLHTDHATLRASFERAEVAGMRTPETLEVLAAVQAGLHTGQLQIVEKNNGGWQTNSWLKRALLLQSRLGEPCPQSSSNVGVEMDTAPWSTHLPQGCFAPSGSHIRQSAFVGPGTALNPSAVIQAGAFVGNQCVIDSHVLVGICAHIGDRVIIQGGTVIGGQILPLETMPNIVEDDCFLNGNSGIYDGIVLGAGSILLPGTVLRASGGAFDLRTDSWIRPDSSGALQIPPMSVIGMGSTPIGPGARNLHLTIPIILGTRRSLSSLLVDYANGMPNGMMNPTE